MKRACVLLLAAISGGCGSNALSCIGAAMGIKVSCIEVDNPPPGAADQERVDCTKNGGAPHDGPCDRAGALGGCRSSFPGASFSITSWFYSSPGLATAADVMKLCTQQSSTFVTP